MLLLRHSIGNASPLEFLARNSKNVPHLRCYASPPPTETCARITIISLSCMQKLVLPHYKMLLENTRVRKEPATCLQQPLAVEEHGLRGARQPSDDRSPYESKFAGILQVFCR